MFSNMLIYARTCWVPEIVFIVAHPVRLVVIQVVMSCLDLHNCNYSIYIYMCIIEKFISSQIEKVGQYRANQFWIEIGHLEFIKTLDKVETFSSTYLQPHCQIRPVSRGMYLIFF
jgi:hypothetical protein